MIIATLILVPLLALVYTLVLSVLWRWFLVPLGLPELALAHLYGVGLIVQFMTHPTREYKAGAKADVEIIIGNGLIGLFRAGLALAAGWIALQLWGAA